MNNRARLALGLAGGYLLGRLGKGRVVVLLAAGIAGQRLAKGVANRGATAIGSAPELRELAEQGREAAVSILGRQVEGLTDRIEGVTRSLRQAAGEHGDGQQDGDESDETQKQEESPQDEPTAEAEPDEDDQEQEEDQEPADQEPKVQEGRTAKNGQTSEDQTKSAKSGPAKAAQSASQSASRRRAVGGGSTSRRGQAGRRSQTESDAG